MTESVVQDSPLKQLLDRVMAAKQLTSTGAKVIADMGPSLQNAEDMLCRPANECGMEFAALDDCGLGRQLLSLFLVGAGVGKSTVPEVDWALSASLCRQHFEKFKQQREQELK